MKVDSNSFFRGRQPPACSPSLARCSTINSTLEQRRARCLKKQSCYHVSEHAPNPHSGIKPFLICKTPNTLLWTGRHFQQDQRCVFFLPHLTNSVFSSWTQMGSSASSGVFQWIPGKCQKSNYSGEETTRCCDSTFTPDTTWSLIEWRDTMKSHQCFSTSDGKSSCT